MAQVAKRLSVLGVALGLALAGLSPLRADEAAALQARHAALRPQLADNSFQRPLYLESHQQDGTLAGDIYARIDQPFAVVAPALQGPAQWCDILILHLNVKGCRALTTATGPALRLHLGRKVEQALDDAFPVQFDFRVAAARPDYLRIVLDADKGPLYTRDYRILLEAVPLDAAHSFLHLSYSYRFGVAARAALQGYLASLGRDKVGFSVVAPQARGRDRYIGGLRGVVERNTMRYFLAVDAYLDALALPPGARQERRLQDWHRAVERYPLQLHELEREDYLRMKRKEIARQRAADGGQGQRPAL